MGCLEFCDSSGHTLAPHAAPAFALGVRLGQGRRCAELLRGDGLDLELEPASATSATSATGDVVAFPAWKIPKTTLHGAKESQRVDRVSAAQIVDGQRNPPHLMSEMASALLIRLALPDPREKGRMAVG